MNILIYFPYNQRSVEQQSVMEMLVQKGHTVFLLTLSPENYLHDYVRGLGVKAFASPIPGDTNFIHIFKNAKYLVHFCKLHQVDVILAHQQLAALPLIFAAPFLKNIKSYYVRHNSDEDYKDHPVKARLMNGFINRFMKNIIAPSDIVYDFMIEKEKVPPAKMRRINYGYNFSQYEKPVIGNAGQIREKYACKILIISIARLVPAKRHLLMFDAVKQLAVQRKDIKMICLGQGQLKPGLETWINENNMQNHIYLLGSHANVFDYLSAADILLHLSETEASNSVVKETGLAQRPAIVCNHVGDFADYVLNGQNGFLVDKENPVPGTVKAIEDCYMDAAFMHKLGAALYETVTKEFDIQNVSEAYDELLSDIKE